MSEKIELIGLSKEELTQQLKDLGEPAFRAKQIWQWIYYYGKTDFEAAKIAADYTVKCIENTIDDPNHWYGAKFETAIPELIKALKI